MFSFFFTQTTNSWDEVIYVPTAAGIVLLLAILAAEDTDLAVVGLGSPPDSVFTVSQITGQAAHDAAMAGDQYILIILCLQFL